MYDVVKHTEELLEEIRADHPRLASDKSKMRIIITDEQRNLLCRALMCLAATNDRRS